MADKREAILERLEEIVAAVDGFTTTGRNHADLEDDDLPVLAIIDGDETAEDTSEGDKKQPGLRPRIMVMAPVISAVLLGKREENGPAAALLRASIVNAITTDTTLQGLCLNKRMSYEGCKTLPSRGGRGDIYAMSLVFTFTYAFRPSDLAEGVLSPDGSIVESSDGSEVI